MYRRQLAALATRLPQQLLSMNTARLTTARCLAVRSLSTSTRPCSNYRLAQLGVSRQYSSKSYPPHTVIPMPALSPTMTQGNLGVWHKKVGDAISAGDVLVEIETDKAQMDFECQDDGYLAHILVESGTKDVEVNKPIAIFVEDKADIEKFADYKVEGEGAAQEEPKKAEPKKAEPKKTEPTAESKEVKQESAPKPAASEAASGSDRIVASPLAKSLASQKGISLNEVTGSGPGGRITKADIDAHVPSDKTEAKKIDAGKKKTPAPSKAAPVAGAEYTDIPLTNMRKVIAERLTSSKQTVPHYYLTVEIQMDRILKLREVLNKDARNGTPKLSVNDFIVKASALALKAVPEANSAWNENSIRQFHNADICIATSTPGGLITPIVRRAESLGLSGISSAVRDLATRAREGKLQPHEYQGGSFTISNLGMFGIKSFTAIINPPQACILAIGTTEKKVVVAPKESGKEFEEITVMAATLSSDHRVVDGAVGATWLKAFKGYMEQASLIYPVRRSSLACSSLTFLPIFLHISL